MSVQTPATVEDLFDRLKALDDFTAIADQKGLDDAPFKAFIQAERAATQAQIAAAVKFPPGAPVKLVLASDGAFYAYDQDAGADAYTRVTPILAASLDLDGNAIPEVPPAQAEPAPAAASP